MKKVKKSELPLQKKLTYKIVYGLYMVILSPLAAILWICNFRTLDNYYSRIGHLATDTYCSIVEKQYYSIKKNYLIIINRKTFANKHFIKYLRKYCFVLDIPYIYHLLLPLNKHPFISIDVSAFSQTIEAAFFPKVLEHAKMLPPLFQLDEEDKNKGGILLEQLGLPEGAWFVCVHNRGSGYGQIGGVINDGFQDHRNCSISSFDIAIDEVIRRGGFCIRMGDPTMEPVNPRYGLIDYAHHSLRSEFMDIYLCASCRFFLGNSSGLFLVSSIFGIPSACTNMTPLGGSLVFGENEISIPKLYYKGDQLISFVEIFNSPSANFRWGFQFRDAAIELKENTPEDILGLTMEMFDRLESPTSAYSTEDDLLQTKFRSLMNQTNYSVNSSSRIGREFLKRYQHLLQ